MSRFKLVAFDLDYTLWPFWVDTHVDPPFQKKVNGTIYDARGKKVECFPDVPEILERLKAEGYMVAFASRTGEIRGAKQLVKLFGWEKYADMVQIYPGRKVPHFNYFHNTSGIPYSEMLFFDDEERNIHDISRLGVTCIHVPGGMTVGALEAGLSQQ